jgi:maltooligosyltrehalose trehalohydrolase
MLIPPVDAVGDDRSWPSLGADADGGGVYFRVWAPRSRQVGLALDPLGEAPRRERRGRSADGTFAGTFDAGRPGDLYMCLFDGESPFPDPCSRFQPQDDHGRSAVVDPSKRRE